MELSPIPFSLTPAQLTRLLRGLGSRLNFIKSSSKTTNLSSSPSPQGGNIYPMDKGCTSRHHRPEASRIFVGGGSNFRRCRLHPLLFPVDVLTAAMDELFEPLAHLRRCVLSHLMGVCVRRSIGEISAPWHANGQGLHLKASPSRGKPDFRQVKECNPKANQLSWSKSSQSDFRGPRWYVLTSYQN